MADVTGISNLTSSSNGADSLTGIKAAAANLNSDKAETSTTISAGTGLTGGGSLAANRTLTLSTPVSIANGGTSGSTAAAGFDALAPTTTRGDLIVRGASSNGRLAVGSATQVLHGGATDPAYSAVVEADITLSDNTTNDVSTTKHGFVPKAPNLTTKFLRADGTWAGVISLPKIFGYAGFETTGRYSLAANGAGVTPAFNSAGVQMATGATAGSSRTAWGALNGASSSIYAAGGVFVATAGLNTLNGTGSVFIGLGLVTVSSTGHTFTDSHIGFKILISGGVATLYGTVAAGTETATSALTTLTVDDSIQLMAIINSTSSVDFYYSKNGATLSAATNVTTNIPTAAGEVNAQCSISNDNTNNSNIIRVQSMGYGL